MDGMTDAQIVLLLGSIGNALLTGWNAYVLWRDRRDKTEHQNKLEILVKEREDKEREHRHKMAELQQMQMFELEKMSRMVSDAKVVAVETKRDLTRKLDESKEKRDVQLRRIEAKVDDNTKKTEEGIDASNHVNEKFAALGLTHLTSKTVELQQEGNEKLEEIAENTAPIPALASTNQRRI